MMYLIISILGVLLTLTIVIGFHEFSHFITARLFGVKVLRFSIGFGKKLFSWRDKKGTEYVIALIPLGGYVQMLGENKEDHIAPKDLPHAYNRQPFYKKFLIVLAGPVSNLICAMFLYWIIFITGFVAPKVMLGKIDPGSIAALAGVKANSEIVSVDHRETLLWPAVFFRIVSHAGNQDQLTLQTKEANQKVKSYTLNLENWSMDSLNPDPLGSLGLHPYIPTITTIVGDIKKNSPAALSGLKMNDKIIAINNKKISKWEEITTQIEQNPNQTLVFTVQRNNQVLKIPIQIGSQYKTLFTKQGFLGVSPIIKWPENFFKTIQYNPIAAISEAWDEVINFIYFNFMLIGKLLVGKISIQSMGGPITIFEAAGDTLNSGILTFMSFLAFINISIGVLNLLPIPGLDGSHLFIQIIEAIIRRPLPEKFVSVLFRLGFLFLLLIMVQTFINDILRL